MASTSHLSTPLFCTTSPPPPSLFAPSFSYNVSKRKHYSKHSINCNLGSIRTPGIVAACTGSESGPREEHTPLETVLKLYEAIKNKNANELSDIIAEECSCVSNFVSSFQPFLGKKQVLTFFSCLMKNLGNNLQFVVQQTSDDGMVVGVTWKLEWDQVPLYLGKGFSLYTCHVYQGKVMIKNVEMFLEPILHIEPFLRMKLITLVMTAMEKLNPQNTTRRKAIILWVVFFIVIAMLFLLRHRMLT